MSLFKGSFQDAFRPRSGVGSAARRRDGARIILVGNEKGGAGKSTVSALIATALLYRNLRVAVIDLDLRQQSLSRLLANRRHWLPAAGVSAPVPMEYKLAEDTVPLADDQATAMARFAEAVAMAARDSDVLVIDTPGADTPVARAAYLQADQVITPMNDSFVDFDVLGEIDSVTLKLLRPSHYAEEVMLARSRRAEHGRDLDWVVLRNRLAGGDNNNRQQVERALLSLSTEIGFRIGPSLRERVAYREMFPFGLTLADVAAKVKPGMSAGAKLAAREEVEALLNCLNLPQIEAQQQRPEWPDRAQGCAPSMSEHL